MAPTAQKIKTKNFTAKEGALSKTRTSTTAVKKKRKWVHEHKVFEGSVKEGEFLDKRAFYEPHRHQITIKL